MKGPMQRSNALDTAAGWRHDTDKYQVTRLFFLFSCKYVGSERFPRMISWKARKAAHFGWLC